MPKFVAEFQVVSVFEAEDKEQAQANYDDLSNRLSDFLIADGALFALQDELAEAVSEEFEAAKAAGYTVTTAPAVEA